MERAELRKLVLATGKAEEHRGGVFLYDPGWSVTHQDYWRKVTRKHRRAWDTQDGWLCIPTGGTSGRLRFARHDERTVGAAVNGFCEHFGVRRVNALDVLPPYHVSGLMARIRCTATGGEHVVWSWKQLESGEWPRLSSEDDGWFLSLVPTQLQRLLQNEAAVARLRDFRAVFLGGGPAWPELVGAARAARLPISVCYGMTETAAMVVAQRPGDFLAGDESSGTVMSHAQVEIVDENTGERLPIGATGLVRISGQSIFHGYWPESNALHPLATQDIGSMDHLGRLKIFGRRDAVIITGGKKVHPAEVEAVLRTTGEFDDVAVIGVPDGEWGSAVVACHSPCHKNLDTIKIEQMLAGLESYKRPKRFLAISPWPRNAQGKLNRTVLAHVASAGLNPG